MDNKRIADIGENMVVVKLMQKGWDALNINQVFNNYKSVDIICIDPNYGRTQLVQVKTGKGKNPFPTGFYSDNKGNIKDFEVKGPWVFVKVTGEDVNMDFEFYILSKSEVKKLISQSNDWYMNKYHRENVISDNTPVGIKLKWLQGEGEEDTTEKNSKKTHEAFDNPLKESAKDKWEKIWEV